MSEAAYNWLCSALIDGSAKWGKPLDKHCEADAIAHLGSVSLRNLADEVARLRRESGYGGIPRIRKEVTQEELDRAEDIIKMFSEAYDPGVVPVFTDEKRCVNYYHVKRAVAAAYTAGFERAYETREIAKHHDENKPFGSSFSDYFGSEVDRLRYAIGDLDMRYYRALHERNEARSS